jgi:hypothetical protein
MKAPLMRRPRTTVFMCGAISATRWAADLQSSASHMSQMMAAVYSGRHSIRRNLIDRGRPVSEVLCTRVCSVNVLIPIVMHRVLEEAAQRICPSAAA